MFDMFPIVTLTKTDLAQTNALLEQWEHKMGRLHRVHCKTALCHVLLHGTEPVAVTTASTLIKPPGGVMGWMTRDNTVELSRLCAIRPALCRVMLRLWREFVFPSLGYQYALSYQDADVHTGNTYRFDGWHRIAYSHSGVDSHSGRKGRNKWLWVWPEPPVPTK